MTLRRLKPALILSSILLLFFTPVQADTLAHYEYCLVEGKKAFDRGDDSEASRYFRLAHRLNPLGEKPYQYLQRIAQRKDLPSRVSYAVPTFVNYDDLMRQGQEALARGDREEALDAFYKALIMGGNDPRPLEYINLIKRLREEQAVPVGRDQIVAGALDQFGESALPAFTPPIMPPEKSEEPLAEAPLPAAVENISVFSKDEPPPFQAQHVVSASPDTLREDVKISRATSEPSSVLPNLGTAPVADDVPRAPSSALKKQVIIDTLSLSDVMAGGERPHVFIDLWSAVNLEGQNIQRFLVMDPDVVEVKTLTQHQVQIKALKRGTTFLHIWDASGRSTVNVTVVLPPPSGDDLVLLPAKLEHARPFRVVYANDWGSYYYGHDIPALQRRSLSFQQTLGVDGETPYGDFDASGAFSGYGDEMHSTTYTVGLSGVPVPGTTALDLRLFDANRYLSPLTLPGVRLRGGFLDTIFFKDMIGLSLTHGRLQPAFGYIYGSSRSARKVYTDAFRLTLFPRDRNNQLSVNYAKSYGADREEYLTEQAYSIEGRKKIEKFQLSGELASDDQQLSSMTGVQWEDGPVRTGLNFRDINKNYTTVTNPPSGQGEIGGTWTADGYWEDFTASAALDVFQDRLSPNPQDPQALNYDTSFRIRTSLNETLSLDSNVNYIDTPGQVSPRNFSSGNLRVSKVFDAWGGRKGTTYLGGSLQRARYDYVPQSEYDRCSLISGVHFPLAKGLECYANYEYSWLHEPNSGLDSNPNVLNAGINYYKEWTRRLGSNFGVAYRNEEDVRGVSSFLAGEDSLMFSSGLSFTPADDINLFMDGRLRSVWAQIPDNASYNDMDLRLGMRMSLGTSLYWDPKGGISGFVFKDQNGDGRYTVRQDEGLAGIKVKVGDREAVTNEKGWYRIEVRSKKVTVTPVLESIPQGFIFSTPASAEVNIVQGISKRIDFGLTTQSGIYGVIFVDNNANGIPDKDDQFVARVSLILDGDTRQLSDSRGAYFFKNVAPGKHSLSLDMKSVPIEFIPQVKLKNDVDVVEGTTYIFHVPLKIKSLPPTAPKPPPTE